MSGRESSRITSAPARRPRRREPVERARARRYSASAAGGAMLESAALIRAGSLARYLGPAPLLTCVLVAGGAAFLAALVRATPGAFWSLPLFALAVWLV